MANDIPGYPPAGRPDSAHDPVSRAEFNGLKELFALARVSDKENIAIALTAAKEAVSKAETANEKRFDLLNEFRAQSADFAAHYVTREVYDTNHTSIQKIVATVSDRIAMMEGRFLGVAAIVGLTSLAIALFELLKK